MGELSVRDRAAGEPFGQPGWVYDRIRDEIVAGCLGPNERLKVSELAARYGTSTNPIREALQLLRGEGFVVIEPNRGARVRPIDEEERYRRCFASGWYLTGDLARRDADGYFWFVGRADDVIKSSGHLIGPFEVESALMEHPAVAEAGVIGKPDPVAGEIVKAFVALKPGFDASEALLREIHGFARSRLGAAVAPKELAFVPQVPKTRSGKILRRLLKARELGLPEGDTSTLEGDA